MNTKRVFRPLLTGVFCFSITCCYCQLDKILKSGEKLLEKSPSRLMERYFSNAPVTTSFDDAKAEVMLLGNFDPPESDFLPLHMLPQNARGNYIMKPGLYTTWNKSFCLKAGTHGPSNGDGYLYAPLAGPKAYLVRQILENWQTKAPDIPQTDVQCLLWAIIARTDVDKMQPKYKANLARLLDKEDIARLAANSLRDKAMEAGIQKFRAEIPPSVYKVFAAESQLRSLYGKAGASYEQFESLAMLAGMAPRDMVREVSKARWSWHPNGYFIRLTPHGYSTTKVDVYIPMQVETLTDSLGRIRLIRHGDNHIEFMYDNNIAAQYETSSSGLAAIHFTSEDSLVIVQAPAGLQPAYVNTGFSFAEKDASFGTKLWEYTSWLSPAKTGLELNMDQADKAKLFNLGNTQQVIESLPAGSLNGLQPYLKFILTEARNYQVYKSLVAAKGTASIKTGYAPAEQLLVVTAMPAYRAGPRFSPAYDFSDEPTINPPAWFQQDAGELDLPGGVATPANRSSQRIGQSKPPRQKPWYDTLPPCPCTYKAAQDSAKRKGSGWMDCGGASQTYHYGATSEVRWAGKNGGPGQQCTYDSSGNLITSGLAAGSPDRVSPQACGASGTTPWTLSSTASHFVEDVHPWKIDPCWTYLQHWPANNGNNCPKNPVADITGLDKLVGVMTCPEITELFDAAAKSKNIDPDLRDYLQGKPITLTDQQIKTALDNWKKADGKPHSEVIDKAIKNMK